MKKRKTYEISVIDKTYSKIISDETKFYTSDTALELTFELKETEYNFESAEIVLLNVDDRSLATRPVSKINNDFVYEIDDDITSHYGDWRGQLMLVEKGEVHVSSPIKFRIENDLYCNKPLEITEVVSWVSLKRYADGLIDELKQAVLSAEGLEDTFNANETTRQNTFETNESERDKTFNDNETVRQTQELEREGAESKRQTVFDGNEANRTETFNVNEATRQENEDARIESEKQRVEGYQEVRNFIDNFEIGENSVGTENIKNESIRIEKIEGYEGENFNLYRFEEHAIKGLFLNSSGQLITDVNNGAYAEVPVNQLTKYTLWRPDGKYTIGNGALVFKDAQGNNISFVAMSTLRNGVYNGVSYITFETPANTTNILFNLKLSTFDSTKTAILVKGSALNDDLLNNKQVLKLFDANLVDQESRERLNNFISTVKGTGGNLYNKDRDYKEGAYSSTNGTILQDSGWGLADVPVNDVSKVSIWKPDGNFSGQIGAIGFYKDDEKLGYSYMPATGGSYNGVGFVTLTLPEGTNRLLITVKMTQPAVDNSDGLIVVEGETINSNALEARLVSVNGYDVPKIEASQSSKPYLDVKWTVVGDSLTELNDRSTKFYHEYIADELGFNVTNMGISGTGYKRRDEANNAFYQRILNVPTDSEVVTIFGSFNDLGAGVPHGTKSDTGTDTLGGAINTTIDNLYSILPTTPLGIISPTPWHTSKIDNPENSATTYAKLLEDICHDRGIPFLNLYHSSGLRPWEESYRNLVYDKDPVGNGTHPNEVGHKLISTQIREFLKTLI